MGLPGFFLSSIFLVSSIFPVSFGFLVSFVPLASCVFRFSENLVELCAVAELRRRVRFAALTL